MIKVAFIIDTIESPTAGTEKQLLMLIRYLDRTRFAPTLFVLHTSSWLDQEFDLCPLVVIGFSSYFKMMSYKNFIQFVKMLREQRFDILQTHFVDSNIIGIIGAKFAGVSYVISSRRDQGYWHTPTKLLLFKILNRWVKYFVANCQATAIWASETEVISLDRIKVVYNGIELQNFSPYSLADKNDIRHQIGLQESSIVVVVVANLRPVKQIDVFLRAAALVSVRLSDARFLIVGDGEQRNDLEILAVQLGISDKCIFLGKRTDVPRILRACDIAVLSSSSESFSNSIIEYFASGLPVVSTDVGGCREIIEEGIDGYLVAVSDYFALAEHIIKLAINYDIKHINESNKKKAKNMFSREAMVTAFEQLYTEGINKIENNYK